MTFYSDDIERYSRVHFHDGRRPPSWISQKYQWWQCATILKKLMHVLFLQKSVEIELI